LNLNKRLDTNVFESEYFLLPQDVLAAMDYLMKTKFGIGMLDDIDHFKNRCIRSIMD
jgi:DNA-directed RNA polymerase subunit beta